MCLESATDVIIALFVMSKISLRIVHQGKKKKMFSSENLTSLHSLNKLHVYVNILSASLSPACYC